MIIHHQDGTKLGIHPLKKVVKGKSGSMYLLFESPKGNKSIIELSPPEAQSIWGTLPETSIDDALLWRFF